MKRALMVATILATVVVVCFSCAAGNALPRNETRFVVFGMAFWTVYMVGDCGALWLANFLVGRREPPVSILVVCTASFLGGLVSWLAADFLHSTGASPWLAVEILAHALIIMGMLHLRFLRALFVTILQSAFAVGFLLLLKLTLKLTLSMLGDLGQALIETL